MTDEDRALLVERYGIMSLRQLRLEWQKTQIGSAEFDLISAELVRRNTDFSRH